jgi:hypothetical protein
VVNEIDHIPSTKVSLPRSHYNAVRRVLKLLSGYLGDMPMALHGHAGGMMTTGELLEHVNAAAGLMPPPRKRKRK